MFTLIQSENRGSTEDAARAFAQLARASGGRITLQTGGRDKAEAFEHEGRPLLIDTLLSHDDRGPRLVSGFSKPEIHTLTAGLDPRLRVLKPEARAYDILRIVTCNEIAAGRGWEEAGKVFAWLDSQNIAWQWYIFGEPRDEDYFETLTKGFEAKGWEESITFVGDYKLDKFLHLAMNMDLALFPAVGDSLHICPLEAAQLGLPLVVFDEDFAKLLVHRRAEDHIFLGSPFGVDHHAWERFLASFLAAKETLRIKREFAQLKTWAELSEELLRVSAGIPSD